VGSRGVCPPCVVRAEDSVAAAVGGCMASAADHNTSLIKDNLTWIFEGRLAALSALFRFSQVDLLSGVERFATH